MGICDSSSNNKSHNQLISNGIPNSERETLKYFEQNKNGGKQNRLLLSNDVIVSDSGFDPEKVYEKIGIIGEGAYGEVWKVRHKVLGKEFAMKIIEKSPYCNIEEIQNEIEILKQLDHPNILKILDFHMSSNKFYIITDFCKEGELFNEIKKKERFSELETAFVIQQLLRAIRYCHKMRVIHRDIKPENIMIINRETNGFLHIKLIDFGTAKIFSGGNNKQKGIVGTSYYIAPEVIKNNYDESCDLWSIGVIMYIMLIGNPPFFGDDDDSILLNVAIGKFDTTSEDFQNLSNNAKDLIKQLLKFNPSERITARNALKHPWFNTTEYKAEYYKINTINQNDVREMLNNLENYKSDNIIKCAVLAYLIHQNNNIPQCLEAIKLFNEIDLNQDGKLETNELEYAYIKYYGMNKDAARQKTNLIFHNIDTDNNGYIEIEEFIRACINPSIFTSNNYLKFAFDYFDTNRSESISINEIEAKFYQNSKNKNGETKILIKNLFDQIDINHDGEISFEEFSNMIRNIFSNN